MSLTFGDYLDVKFGLDERSLSAEVQSVWRDEIRSREHLDILDLGSGTGATLWRLCRQTLLRSASLTALDRDPDLLAVGRRRLEVLLRARGDRVAVGSDWIRAARATGCIEIRFLTADLEHYGAMQAASHDLVIAHALLDLLPPVVLAERIGRWLRPGGLCWASLNYDGGTVLLPVYRRAELEYRILAVYDQSMERRRVWGEATGGARSGRRWHRALLDIGLEMLALGGSDWNLVPLRGAYRGREAACLEYLLDLIRAEAEASAEFDAGELDEWFADRRALLLAGQLGLICHHLDLLARKPCSSVAASPAIKAAP